jgi:hypothetical protein
MADKTAGRPVFYLPPGRGRPVNEANVSQIPVEPSGFLTRGSRRGLRVRG